MTEINIKQTFNLATQYHQKNNLNEAKKIYLQILKINPNHVNAHNNLGAAYKQLGEIEKAKSCFEKVIQLNPNDVDGHNNLGLLLFELKEIQKAKNFFEKTIQLNPNYVEAHNNLGTIFNELKEFQKAKDCYERAIQLNPNYAMALYNLGIIFKQFGLSQKAVGYFEKAIEINPNYAKAYNGLGIIFNELGNNIKKAKSCFEKALKINPNYADIYWNLHSLVSNIDEAIEILKKLIHIDNNHFNAKSMLACLEYFKGNHKNFNNLINSNDSNDSYIRSFKWVFSLPKLPKLFFNKKDFFDGVATISDKSRPFYEFGVWNGVSFKYLINIFGRGFGFDTFTGIPEKWHDNPAGTYSSFGSIPQISGGEFIVGKFEDTLPKFFSKKRSVASLINFDADLYSSTICALNNTKNIIDEDTILVFDEFLMNDRWEEDEYKALEEFCNNFNFSYDVLAVSFYTKQIGVKLKKL
jgi:tetratricopeptide (TPR) repeat protein